MIGKLITLIFFFVVGWVAYTQFFGSPEEQKMGREVITSGKQTVKGILNIFKHEGDKIKQGTYDDSIDQLGTLLDKLREESKDGAQQEELIQLAEETKRLKEQVEKSKQGFESTNDEQTKEDLIKLTEKVQKVVENMEAEKVEEE